MKPEARLTIGAAQLEVANYEIVLDLNDAGRGFITVGSPDSLAGQVVRLDIGYNGNPYRYFSGYVVRDQAGDNAFRRLFVAELSAAFEQKWPLSIQHPTLRDVLSQLGAASGINFILPEGKSYTDTPIPYFTHSGSGYQLLNNLGRSFSIDDYIWQQMPDGTVWAGSWADSRFAGLDVEIPPALMTNSGSGNSAMLPAIGTLRPGVVVNGQRLTRVAVKDGDMTITWTLLKTDGKPKQKPPMQKQIEKLYPELASNLHLPKFARVEDYAEPAALGDISDPFRPRVAVGVQLLDENGQDNAETPIYPAVSLPNAFSGDEAGLMQYPEPGTLVELGFQEGRPDRPFIRQVLGEGKSLPDIKPGEQLQQQRAGVEHRVKADGTWQRLTDQTIIEESATRRVKADTEDRTVIDRTVTVKADDKKTVVGTHSVSAGKVLSVAKGDHVTASAATLRSQGQDRSETIAQDKESQVGGNQTLSVGGSLDEQIAGISKRIASAIVMQGSTVWMGTADINVMTLMIDTLNVIKQLAEKLASHTHPDTGQPNQSDAIRQSGADADNLKARYSPIIK